MDSSNGTPTWQTLAAALVGGITGAIDAQSGQPIYVQQPLPATQYGIQGQAQYAPLTPAASAALPSWVLPVALVVAAFLLLKR
jgi:hypothetical protein